MFNSSFCRYESCVLLSDNIPIFMWMMKPWTVRLMSLGAVKCIGLCMRLSACLLCSLSEAGRQGRASVRKCNFRLLPSLFSSLN